MENEDSDIEVADSQEDNGSQFQRVVWHHRLLPYQAELEKEADYYFSNIKSGLAYSVLMRDARPGLVIWVYELDRFIKLHSFRFTKQDHVNMLNLLYNSLILKDLDLRVVKILCSSIRSLLSRKTLISREDFQFDWRPLYDLYVQVAYKNLEEDGVFLIPDDMKKILGATILDCNRFFNNSATQEILDEVRPYFCPWDDSSMRGFKILSIFLPTCLTKEEHDLFGAKLWIDELLFFLKAPGALERQNIFNIFARLSINCPGYFDFSPHFNFFFTCLLSSLNIQLGVDRVVALNSCTTDVMSLAKIFAYSFGMSDNKIQECFDQLFLTLESYFHPSNTGKHTKHLLDFLYKLCLCFVGRVSRERYTCKRYVNEIPKKMNITNVQIDNFVKSMMPCLEYAAFAKQKDDFVPSIIRLLAFLSPGIIVPFVLDLVYPSLQTLTEPHRLTQSLQILSRVCVVIARDRLPNIDDNVQRLPVKSLEDFEANTKSYRRHAIILMNNLLPGVDVNDFAKCGLVFQILSIFMMLIPIVDCSQAPLTCTDLTPEEINLCSETASFEFYVDELMRKIFSMLMLLGSSVNDRQDLTSTRTAGKNLEEIVMEKGILIVFRSLVKNCSCAFYKHITNLFYNFVNEHLFNSKPAMNTISKMAGSIVAFDSKVQFSRFFNFAVKKFEEHYHVGSEQEEEVDRALIWYINFAAEIVHNTPGTILLENKSLLDSFISKILCFKSSNIFKLVAVFAQNVLHLLCSVYLIPKSDKLCDQPFDKYLPLRHWAEPINRNEVTLDWHIPTDDEVDYASKLVDQFITIPLQNILANFKDMTDKEILKSLKIAHHALSGCSSLCPFFDGEVLSLIQMATPNVVLDTVAKPCNVKKITANDGSNYRNFLFKIVKQIGENLLDERENDTKSSLELLHIIRILLHERGSNLTNHQYAATSLQLTKKILNDPLRGFTQTVESVMEGTVALMHTKRLIHRPLVGLTQTHVEVLQLAFRFSTSTYALVRQTAQKLLDSSFNWWSFSYKLFIDNLVQILQNKSASYEQFKGTLYILANGKQTSILTRQDWETVSKLWPTLCLAESPDSSKQSIVLLFDLIRDYIINNHTSFQIEFKFSNNVFPFAKALIEDYDGNLHKDILLISEESIQNSTRKEAEINEKNKSCYLQTATDLCQISANNQLHWRHVDLSRALLSLLLRRDSTLQSTIVLHFFQLLIDDSIKTRKLAVSFCGSWLKINRQKAKKLVKNVISEPNTGPGATWPIKYGIRKDNSFLLYDSDNLPSVQNEWDNAEFLHLPHWGYYVWPKEFKCYAPPSQQDWANRDYSQMNEIEHSIIDILKNKEFLNKFSILFSLEDEKQDREFDAVNFSLFNRIFRTFNDILLVEFIEILNNLLKETKESYQRLASEIIAGIISGSKFWKFEKREKLLTFLIPTLEKFFLEIPQEAEKYWVTCLSTISCCCEPRQVGWLIKLLFQLIYKQTEISSQLKSRIYLLQSLLNEFEWRIPSEWKLFASFCFKLTDNTFQNVRIRAGSCIATCTRFDYINAFYDDEMDEKFKFLTVAQVVDEINKKIEPLWNEAFCTTKNNNDVSIKHVDSNSVLVNVDEFKQEKLSFLTLISVLYSLKSLTGTFTDVSTIRLLPLFTHYSNDKTDEELKASCITHIIQYMGLSLISDDQIDVLFEVCQTIQEKGSWKAKITLLRFLQVFVFTNLFILRAKEGSIDILRALIFKLLIDNRFEVREASAETFSGLVRAGIICINEQVVKNAEQLASSPQKSIERHSGVLALASIVLAFPYSVPSFLPKVLMHLCTHASEPQPIYGTVKRALSEFKRTHQDEWHEHKLEFTEDQLQILTDLIVSPNYYV